MKTLSRAVLAAAVLVASVGCAASKAHMRRAQREGEMLRVELAETYIQKGAYDAAVPLLQRAIAEHPRDAKIRMLYGTVLRERGLYPQAERELRLAVKLARRYPAAWAGLGLLYDLMRRPADAEKAHRTAVRLSPRNATYWNNLGFSLYVAGDTDGAIAALEEALSIDPSLTIAYNNLGFAYGRRGDFEAAERCFRTAGGEGPAKVNLALIYEENGDTETAETLRREAFDIDPDLVSDEEVQ